MAVHGLLTLASWKKLSHNVTYFSCPAMSIVVIFTPFILHVLISNPAVGATSSSTPRFVRHRATVVFPLLAKPNMTSLARSCEIKRVKRKPAEEPIGIS